MYINQPVSFTVCFPSYNVYSMRLKSEIFYFFVCFINHCIPSI